MSQPETIVLAGRGRLLPGGSDATARIILGAADVTVQVGTDTRVAPYRDLATIAVSQGAVLLVLGEGAGAERILLSQFGQGQGQLVRELRERRLLQQLGDALVTNPAEPPDLVEYQAGEEHGVGQVAYHPWGVILAPLDERFDWIRLRRGGISAVDVDETNGRVVVTAVGASARQGRVTLPGLGGQARLHGDRLAALRRGALEDAARLIGALVPDAEYAARREASRVLVDGRPATRAQLPNAWLLVEAGVLAQPTFAASYRALCAKAGELAGARSIAIAPAAPGSDDAKIWFFVPLPGNLVALELVSEGAHATYCFRVQPRTDFGTTSASPDALAGAVDEISEALVDSRFLREPMALTDEALREPAYLRYRLALRALPSLAAARRRFVARIVHRDAVSWGAAIDDLIAWHGAARDEAAEWPGRAAQESQVAGAATAGAMGSGDAMEAVEPPNAGGT